MSVPRVTAICVLLALAAIFHRVVLAAALVIVGLIAAVVAVLLLTVADQNSGNRSLDVVLGGMIVDTPNLGSDPGIAEQRDAIHVAVVPVIAAETLLPGQHVGLTKDGRIATGATNIGVVDPARAESAGLSLGRTGGRWNLDVEAACLISF